MRKCGCRTYGNQHGTWVEFCDPHRGFIDAAAKLQGVTVEEFVNQVVSDYATRVIKEHRK